MKGDYGEFHRAITQLAPKLPKLARKGLALYMAMFHAVNPNPPRPNIRAKTQRDREFNTKRSGWATPRPSSPRNTD